MAQRYSWIWLVAAIVWLFNAGLQYRVHNHNAFLLTLGVAALFFIAWLFFRSGPKR